jgi:hypothetical protein
VVGPHKIGRLREPELGRNVLDVEEPVSDSGLDLESGLERNHLALFADEQLGSCNGLGEGRSQGQRLQSVGKTVASRLAGRLSRLGQISVCLVADDEV